MPRFTFLRNLASVTLNMVDAASDLLVAIGFLTTSVAFGVAAFSILGVHTLVSVAMALSSGRSTTAALQLLTFANGGILSEFYNMLRGYERTAVSLASHLPPVAGQLGVERLKFLESVLESFPQLLLQFLALFTAGEGSVGPFLLFSLSMSLLSLAFACASSDMSGFQEAVQARVVALIVLKEQRSVMRKVEDASATHALGRAVAGEVEAGKGALPSPTQVAADASQPQSPQRRKNAGRKSARARSAVASVAQAVRSATGARAAPTAPMARGKAEAEGAGSGRDVEQGRGLSAAAALDPAALSKEVKGTVLWVRRVLQALTLVQRMLEMASRAGFYIVIAVHGTWQIGVAWLFILGARYLSLYGRQLSIFGFKEGQRAWIEGAGNYAVVKRLLAGVDASSWFIGEAGEGNGRGAVVDEGGGEGRQHEGGAVAGEEAARGEVGVEPGGGRKEAAQSPAAAETGRPVDGACDAGEGEAVCDGAAPEVQGAGETVEEVEEMEGGGKERGMSGSLLVPGPDAVDTVCKREIGEAGPRGGGEAHADPEAGAEIKLSAKAEDQGSAGMAAAKAGQEDEQEDEEEQRKKRGSGARGAEPAPYARAGVPPQLGGGRGTGSAFRAPPVPSRQQAPFHASAAPSQQGHQQQQQQYDQRQQQQPQQQQRHVQQQCGLQRPSFFGMDPSLLRVNAASRVSGGASLFQGATELTEKELTSKSAREHPSAGQLFLFGLPLLLISLLALPPPAKAIPDWIRRRAAPRDSVNVILEAVVVHVLFLWAAALATGDVWHVLTVQPLLLSWLHMAFWILISVVVTVRLHLLDRRVAKLRTCVRREQAKLSAE